MEVQYSKFYLVFFYFPLGTAKVCTADRLCADKLWTTVTRPKDHVKAKKKPLLLWFPDLSTAVTKKQSQDLENLGKACQIISDAMGYCKDFLYKYIEESLYP